MVANKTLPTRRYLGLNGLPREFDELFERVFGGNSPRQGETWNVPMTAWEQNDQMHVQFELPGIKREDLEVSFHEGVLRVAGERKGPEGEITPLRNERYWGRFERVLSLPDTLDPDRIDASYTDGVLHLTLHKLPASQPKKIEIKG